MFGKVFVVFQQYLVVFQEQFVVFADMGHSTLARADLGGGCRGCPPPKMTCGFLIKLVFCKKKTMWFIGVEVEQETNAPPPKKNPGSVPVLRALQTFRLLNISTYARDRSSHGYQRSAGVFNNGA